MGIIRRQPQPFWKSGQNVALLGTFVAVGLISTVVLVLAETQMASEKVAYASTPICTSTADVSSCRFQGPARIVRTYIDKKYQAVEVAFDQLGGRKASADLALNHPSEWQRWTVEDQVQAELWRNRLTLVDGTPTVYDPDNLQSDFGPVPWISGTLTVLLGVAFAWWFVIYRRARRADAIRLATEEAELPTTTQQLPLTPEMSVFLQSDAEAAAHPVQTVLGILSFASVIPAVFTVVFALERILLVSLFFWAMFLALGAIMAVSVLHDARQERRDLYSGVFHRAAGRFSIKLNQTKGGPLVQLLLDGRSLKSVSAPPLESIGSLTGSVDYLPVSGDLLEVRDESGQVLWSRFPATTPAPAAAVQSAAR